MTRPPLNRSRSKSEAELPRLDTPSSSLTPPSMLRDGSSPGTPSPLGKAQYQRRSHNFASPPPLPSAPPMIKRRSTGASSDERWTFRGRADVVNLEVTVGSVMGEERRFEILSPEGSFVVYAGSILILIFSVQTTYSPRV
jgi:FYVE, RhoGEF and PH domain containing 5/6